MQSFTEFFNLHIEKIGLDRVRQVKKAFNKIAKKERVTNKRAGMPPKEKTNNIRFKPGTFGFDIEFAYESEPDIDQNWIKYMQQKQPWIDKFHDWISLEKEIEEPESLDDWEHDNPMPEKVGERARPDPSQYEEGEADPLYRKALDDWEDHRETYEAYIDVYDEWESERERIENAMDYWNDNLKNWWTEFALDTIDQASNYISVENTEMKLEQYGEILDSLGESWKLEDEHENYTKDWNLSVDGSKGNPPEIASRILTYKDMGMVKELLAELGNEQTSNGTSAHIHIGLPKDFDAFAVLTLFQLVDEKYIKERLPTRMFSSFAKFANNTINKVERIILPMIHKNESLWYRTNNRTKHKELISTDDKRMSETQQLNIFFDKDGNVTNREDMDWLKQKVKSKTIKIVEKRGNKKLGYMVVYYTYIDQSKGPFTFDKVKIDTSDEKTLILKNDIVDFIIEKITEKHSGINISYYKDRNVIEFRYLSSDILGDPDEFLEFINYFLFVPHVAQRAKRIKLGEMELRKIDDNKVQIRSS